MIKKALSLSMATALVFSLMTGCGAKEEEGTSTNPPANSSETTTTDSEVKFDDVRLTLLNCWNGAMKSPQDLYNNEVAKAIREKIGVTVEIEGIMMSEVEKLNLMFSSGDMPDMIDAPYWGGNGGETAVIKKAAAEGRLVALEELIKNYPNISDAFDVGVISQAFLENDIDDPSFNGHRYVLPVETPGDEAGITNWAYGVFVRGDVPEALGIDPLSIKTSEQLKDFMIKARDHGFKDVNGNDVIVATTYHEGWDYGQYNMSYNLPQLSSFEKGDDGKLMWGGLTSAFIDKNLFIWELVNQNILDKECFKQTDAQTDEKVGNGTALFAAAQYNVIINSTKLTGLYSSNPEMRYIPVGPLNYRDGTPAKQIEQMGRHGAHGFLIPTTCKNVDAALTWLDFINSEEGMRLCNYGIEGDTYEMNADGQPRLKEEWLEMKRAGQDIYDGGLRDKGVGFYLGGRFVSNTMKTWWGEGSVGDADAAQQELEDYKLLRPVTRIPGYNLNSLANTYDQYDIVSQEIVDGDTEKQYRERAYFAATEAEARSILESYQELIRTKNDGLLLKYVEYAQQQYDSRDDAAN